MAIFNLLRYLLAFAPLWLSAKVDAQRAAKPPAKEIDPNVVQAWTKNRDGFPLFSQMWYSQTDFGDGSPWDKKPTDRACLPGFQWSLELPPGLIERLPVPAEPFALVLSISDITDAGLKSLARLETLQILDISGAGVSGAGLKHLTPLKNLQSLSLSRTKVTDDGLNRHPCRKRGRRSLMETIGKMTVTCYRRKWSASGLRPLLRHGCR